MDQATDPQQRQVTLHDATFIEAVHRFRLPDGYAAAFNGTLLLEAGPWPLPDTHDTVTDIWVPPHVIRAAKGSKARAG